MTFTQTLKLITAIAVASGLANWTMAAEYQAGALSKKEVKFINDASEGGLMEVRMGELGQQKG